MLACTVDLTKIRDVQRWLGFFVLALPILTNQSPEEAILARLEELGKMWLNHGFCPFFQNLHKITIRPIFMSGLKISGQ